MFAGERINVTENRAVLHVALRSPAGSSILVDGHNVVPDVHEVLGRMRGFAEEVTPDSTIVAGTASAPTSSRRWRSRSRAPT